MAVVKGAAANSKAPVQARAIGTAADLGAPPALASLDDRYFPLTELSTYAGRITSTGGWTCHGSSMPACGSGAGSSAWPG